VDKESDIVFTNGLNLDSRVYEDVLYGLLGGHYSNTTNSTESAAVQGGCCANFLEVLPKSGVGGQHIFLDAIVHEAFNTTNAYATHTFTVTRIQSGDDSILAGIFVVVYVDDSVNEHGNIIMNNTLEGLIAIDLVTHKVVRTMDGDNMFTPFDAFGTFDSSDDNFLFESLYFRGTVGWDISNDYGEQWHISGVARFEAYGNTWLVWSERYGNEVIIIYDPWTYVSTNGKRDIMQRFGTPLTVYGVEDQFRVFGLEQDHDSFLSVHNVYFTPSSPAFNDNPTITFFANTDLASQNCSVIEFEFKPVQNSAENLGIGDSVFEVDYLEAEMPYTTKAQGGGMPIGAGVYLVACAGKNHDYLGLSLVDIYGGFKYIEYSYDIDIYYYYSPFTLVEAELLH